MAYEEETPIGSSFSLEDLLKEVEKISCVPKYEKKVEIVVRLWKDGFTVNDENLRSYATKANQEFLEALKRGELPLELKGNADEELEVSVEELKDEFYVSKRTFMPFSGRGYRLGSMVPRVVIRSRSFHKDCFGAPVPPLVLDEALPSTCLQIWLADGRRLLQRFNLFHRISDVHCFVEKVQTTNSPFILTTSPPFRELTQLNLSLAEADLTNVVIIQRPIYTHTLFGQS